MKPQPNRPHIQIFPHNPTRAAEQRRLLQLIIATGMAELEQKQNLTAQNER